MAQSQFSPTNLPKEVSFSGGDGASLITTLPGGRKKLAEVLNKEFENKIRFITSHATGRTQVILVPDSEPGMPTMEISATKRSMLPPNAETMQVSDFLRLMGRPDLLGLIRPASDPSTNRAPRQSRQLRESKMQSTLTENNGIVATPAVSGSSSISAIPTSTRAPRSPPRYLIGAAELVEHYLASHPPSSYESSSAYPTMPRASTTSSAYSGVSKSDMARMLESQQSQIEQLQQQLMELRATTTSSIKPASRRQSLTPTSVSLPLAPTPQSQLQLFTPEQLQQMMAMMQMPSPSPGPSSIASSPKRSTRSPSSAPPVSIPMQSQSSYPFQTNPFTTPPTSPRASTSGSVRKSRLSPRTLMATSGYGQQF